MQKKRKKMEKSETAKIKKNTKKHKENESPPYRMTKKKSGSGVATEERAAISKNHRPKKGIEDLTYAFREYSRTWAWTRSRIWSSVSGTLRSLRTARGGGVKGERAKHPSRHRYGRVDGEGGGMNYSQERKRSAAVVFQKED